MRPPKESGFCLVDHGRKWLIFGQPVRILRGRAQEIQQDVFVRHAWIEADQDIRGEGVGHDPLHSRNSADALFQMASALARPMRQVDTDPAWGRGKKAQACLR